MVSIHAKDDVVVEITRDGKELQLRVLAGMSDKYVFLSGVALEAFMATVKQIHADIQKETT